MSLSSRIALAAALVGLVAGARAQNIPEGTQFDIRTNERINGRDAGSGRIFDAEVANDIRDTNGDVVIRRGARAELIVRRISRDEVAVDLDGITVDGKHYSVPASDVTRPQDRKDGVGANGRTGKYVGGTAMLGTILGAIAGGGKGAAIGALAGGATGAGVQTLTRGRSIDISAESILTFRLDQNMAIYEDRGYQRGNRHYHPRDNR